MLIAVSAILLVLGVLAYRRNLKPGGSGWLLAIRLAVLLLFGAVFIGAVLSRVWIERPRRVAVLLDVSESMTAAKAESAAAAAAEAFPLPSGVERGEWLFADTAVAGEVKGQEPKAKSQIGERTRIGAALKTVGKTRPGAVVLLSDGQDNGEADAVAAARELGVPVYTVGFGGLATRNLAVGRVVLPAVVYSGDTVDVQVRVAATGFEHGDEPPRTPRAPGGQEFAKARVRLRGQEQEVLVGPGTAEQDVSFRMVFDKPGRQVIEARADSLMGEGNYADNTRSVTVDVRPGRVRVAYVTNRPGPGTRMMLRALAGDERLEVEPVVAVTGSIPAGLGTRSESADGFGHVPARVGVFILDNVAESGSPEVWQSIADQVEAGAGALVLAGPDFQPGQSISKVMGATVGRAQTGPLTPELTVEGRLLPWFDAEAVDLGSVPPFAGVRPLSGLGHDPYPQTESVMSRRSPRSRTAPTVWLAAQENGVPLVMAGRAGKGKVVYAAAYPLWRWGFGPEEEPGQGTPLSSLVTGIVRYLAEPDTSPFWLQADKQELHRGEPVRLVMRAVAPDGTPWSRLSVLLGVESADSGKSSRVQVPMTETGGGVYEASLEALRPGQYRAVATVSLTDTVLGRAVTEFAVAEQSIELASTGLNEGLLRAVSEASSGRFFPQDSLPRDGAEVTLGSYQRPFVFDPRRAAWVYVLMALLAGTEWLLRRRRGLL